MFFILMVFTILSDIFSYQYYYEKNWKTPPPTDTLYTIERFKSREDGGLSTVEGCLNYTLFLGRDRYRL